MSERSKVNTERGVDNMYATPDNSVQRLVRNSQRQLRRASNTFKRKVVDNDKERLQRNRLRIANDEATT